MSAAAGYLSSGQAIRALAGLAVKRAMRGKALWICAALGVLPVIVAVVDHAVGHDSAADQWHAVFDIALLLLPVVPAVLVGSSLAEELEEKTSAYLWSRALPRWSIAVGKLAGLAPLCAAILMLSLTASWVGLGGSATVPTDVLVHGVVGIGAAGLIASAICAMWATLVPKHAVAASVAWLLIVDAPLSALSIRLHHLSAAFVAKAIAGITSDMVNGVVTGVALCAVAVAVSVWRIGKME